MSRVGAVLALVIVLALALPSAAHADTPPAGATWTEVVIPSDGAQLHADVYRPRGMPDGARRPVLLLVSPYLGTLEPRDPASPIADPFEPGPTFPAYYRDIIEAALDRGYVFVAVTLRGFGASTGCNDFGGPGEQADAVRSIEWAASQPWSTGRVGTLGLSYDGWTQVMALAGRARGHAAALVMGPVADGYGAYYHGGVRYGPYGYVTPFYFQYLALLPPNLRAPTEQQLAVLRSELADPLCHLRNLPAAGDNRFDRYWLERDLRSRAAGSTVPVLWAHGFLDPNTRPDQFPAVFSQLAGPRRAWFGQFSHWPPTGIDRGGAAWTGRDGYLREALDWLDAYVAEDPAARDRAEAAPRVVVQDSAGRWRAEAQWPPADAATARVDLAPGTYTDAPGNEAEPPWRPCEASPLFDAHCAPPESHGQGTWTVTPPLASELRMAGEPVAGLTVRPLLGLQTTTIVLLYDIDGAGRARLVTRGAALARRPGWVQVRLYPEDWAFAPGHRLGVLVTGSDDWWYTPGLTLQPVHVPGGSVALPVLRSPRTAFLDGGPSADMARRSAFTVPAAARASTRVRPLRLP